MLDNEKIKVKGDRLLFQFGSISVAPFFLSQKAGRECQLNVGSHERASFLSGGGQKTANAAGSRLGQGPTLLETGRVLGPRDSTDGNQKMTTLLSSLNYCNRQSKVPHFGSVGHLSTAYTFLFGYLKAK